VRRLATSCPETRKVVRFNWPKYLAAPSLVAAVVIARRVGAPSPAVVALLGAASLGAWWSTSSILATWWVYDHRRVYRHVADGLGDVGAWASVHAGFDDATTILAEVLGRSPTAVVREDVRAGRSLRRARRSSPARVVPCAGDLGRDLDTVFVTFVAHEVRDVAAQRALFARLASSLRPGGRLVVTEHRRDLANGAAFGPGALHFRRGSTWSRRAGEVGLRPVGDTSLSGLVHRTVWAR
jgi:hypothetical protein